MRVFIEFSGPVTGYFPDSFPERARLALSPVVQELVTEHCRGGGIPEDVFLSIEFIDEEGMRELNRRFLGEDAPTDVLSFPMWETEGVFKAPAGWSETPLGDIVVCPEVVRSGAISENRDPDADFLLALIHGFLHLLAWDHDTEERETEMFAEQDALLRRYMETV